MEHLPRENSPRARSKTPTHFGSKAQALPSQAQSAHDQIYTTAHWAGADRPRRVHQACPPRQTPAPKARCFETYSQTRLQILRGAYARISENLSHREAQKHR